MTPTSNVEKTKVDSKTGISRRGRNLCGEVSHPFQLSWVGLRDEFPVHVVTSARTRRRRGLTRFVSADEVRRCE
jgi:hypothetical protein